MPHYFEIDPETGILKEAYVGKLDLDTLKKANDSIITDPCFVEGLNFLTDLREAEICFGYDEMVSHAHSLPRLRIKKQAFIVKEDREYGMSRMFETLTEISDLYEESEIFKTIEEGIAWLKS